MKRSTHLETNAMLELTARFAPPDFPCKKDFHFIKAADKYRASYKDLLYSMRDFAVQVFNEYCLDYKIESN